MGTTTKRATITAARAALVGVAMALLALIATDAGRSFAIADDRMESVASVPADELAQSQLSGVYVTARDIRDLFPH